MTHVKREERRDTWVLGRTWELPACDCPAPSVLAISTTSSNDRNTLYLHCLELWLLSGYFILEMWLVGNEKWNFYTLILFQLNLNSQMWPTATVAGSTAIDLQIQLFINWGIFSKLQILVSHGDFNEVGLGWGLGIYVYILKVPEGCNAD
jgi:hypothetical protein